MLITLFSVYYKLTVIQKFTILKLKNNTCFFENKILLFQILLEPSLKYTQNCDFLRNYWGHYLHQGEMFDVHKFKP